MKFKVGDRVRVVKRDPAARFAVGDVLKVIGAWGLNKEDSSTKRIKDGLEQIIEDSCLVLLES